jgi:hypothetical protein
MIAMNWMSKHMNMPVLTGYVLDFNKQLVDDSLSEDSLSEDEPSEGSSQGQIAEQVFFDIPVSQNKSKLMIQNKSFASKSYNKSGLKVSTMDLENIIEVTEDGSPCVIKQSSAVSEFKAPEEITLQTSIESPDCKKHQKDNVDDLDSDDDCFTKAYDEQI